MKRSTFPPLKELIGSWRSYGEFFFLGKFLDESRGLGYTKQPTRSANQSPKKVFSTFRRAIGWLIAVFKFFLLIARCAITPKNRTLIFNHSARVRRTGGELRPLYLSSRFDLSKIIVFEDARLPLSYANPGLRLSSIDANRAANLLSVFLSRLYKIRTGTTDSDIIDFAIKRAIWRLIFRLISPASIHLIVWYGKEAIISAAKSLQIHVSDIQHGIIYRSHPFYNLEQSQNIPGSTRLLPDVCFVYGKYWRDLLLQSGWPAARVKIIGYFLDIDPARFVDVDSPYILYTTQPHTSQIIKQHIQSILPDCRQRGWKIIIAPHPDEAVGLYRDIISDQVILAENDSYDLLRECVVHISVSSTLLWEAMIFNKPSYILKFGFEAQEFLADLVTFGFGRPIEDGEFPSPYSLPAAPSRKDFFEENISFSALEDIEEIEPWPV